MIDAGDFMRRVDDVLRRYHEDLAAGSAGLVKTLDEKPEVRIYLDMVGVPSISNLSPEQRSELTDLMFRAMNARVHPNAN